MGAVIAEMQETITFLDAGDAGERALGRNARISVTKLWHKNGGKFIPGMTVWVQDLGLSWSLATIHACLGDAGEAFEIDNRQTVPVQRVAYFYRPLADSI